MDSTESILHFSNGRANFLSQDVSISFDYDMFEVKRNMDLLNIEYETYKANPYTHRRDDLKQILQQLHTILIDPVKGGVSSRIYLYPDAAVREVPWNILVDREGSYFLENHEITILTGAPRARYKPINYKDLGLYFLAPRFFGGWTLQNDQDTELLNSMKDAKVVDSALADLVHVSSHGNKEGILLDHRGTILCQEEVKLLKLKAKLVFLNTCYSSSMASSFMDAGAGSVIGNLWQVDDLLAIQISSTFYEGLRNGQRVSEAMQGAILQSKSIQGGNLHPLSFGGYQVYGRNQQVVENGAYDFKKIISQVLSLLTTISVLLYYLGGKIISKLMEYNLI